MTAEVLGTRRLSKHADDGPLPTFEHWRQLLPRPGDGVEHSEPDEMALESADFIHHETRSRAAQRQPADFLHRGKVGDRGERLPIVLHGIKGVQLVRASGTAIFEQKQPRARIEVGY